MDINTIVDNLVKQNLGKPVEKEDAANLDQCFDWAFAYVDALGIPRSAIRHLRAYEIWTLATDETRKYFDLIPNTADFVPKKGDLVIFGTAVGVSGHVCLASGNNQGTTTFQSSDQNWNGHAYVEYIWHNYGPQDPSRARGVLGVLRPKNVQAPVSTTPMATITQKDLDQLRADRDFNYNNWQATLKELETTKKARDDNWNLYQEAKKNGDPRYKNFATIVQKALNDLG